MKKLFALLIVLCAQQSMAACLDAGSDLICTGDTVYKGTQYGQGAEVVAVNLYKQTATVRSKISGNLATEAIADLDITRGCVDYVCVGETIFKGTQYSQGAEVIAVNSIKKTATVRSKVSGNLALENILDLDSGSACLGGICTGDLVYKDTQYGQGAIVVAINFQNRTATVQSNISGNKAIETIDSLYRTKGCTGPVCVGAIVYKGTQYGQGAEVLAVSRAKKSAIVRSKISGNLAVEQMMDLDVTN